MLIQSSAPNFKKVRTDSKKTSWFGFYRRTSKALAFIITDQELDVSNHILLGLKRGVTSMGDNETMLLICALTLDEIKTLKAVVSEVDANATINISPASEVWGRGFSSLIDE